MPYCGLSGVVAYYSHTHWLMVHRGWMAQWKWHNTSFNVLFSSSPVYYTGPLRAHRISNSHWFPLPDVIFSSLAYLQMFFMHLLHCSIVTNKRYLAAECNCTQVESWRVIMHIYFNNSLGKARVCVWRCSKRTPNFLLLSFHMEQVEPRYCGNFVERTKLWS